MMVEKNFGDGVESSAKVMSMIAGYLHALLRLTNPNESFAFSILYTS